MKPASSELAAAANGMIEAALLGLDWAQPMDAFAKAAGALGLTLVRETPTGPRPGPAHSACLVATQGVAAPVSRYLGGRAPPDPRLARVSPTLAQGFVTDFDCFRAEEIAKDPFYQEFLRPEGLQWHACARLAGSAREPQLYLSLKREADRGPYGAGEVKEMNRVLPHLRAAASMAQAVFRAEARGRGRTLLERGMAAIELDDCGRIVNASNAAEPILRCGLASRASRLVAPQEAEQAKLDAAIVRSLAPTRLPGCAVLSGRCENTRLILRTLPVTGAARDVFCGISVVVHVTVLAPPTAVADDRVQLLRDVLGLTMAEARVVFLVGQGVSVERSARMLGLSIGTLRNYLKAAMAKIGVGRQVELAVLLTNLAV